MLDACVLTKWLWTVTGVSLLTLFLQFYVRPRGGVQTFDEGRAARLRAMLVASVQRRHPKGLKVHVHSVDRYGCLAALTRVLKAASLSVTRAKVRLYACTVHLVTRNMHACHCVSNRLVLTHTLSDGAPAFACR